MRSQTLTRFTVGLVAVGMIASACGGSSPATIPTPTSPSPSPTRSPSPSPAPLSTAEQTVCNALANVRSLVAQIQPSLATGQADLPQRLADLSSQVTSLEEGLRSLGMAPAADTVHQLNQLLTTLQGQIASGSTVATTTAQTILGLIDQALAVLAVCGSPPPG